MSLDSNTESSLRKPKVFVWQILRHCVTKEGLVRKLLYCFLWMKEPCVRKSEGLTHSKTLEILQTESGPVSRDSIMLLTSLLIETIRSICMTVSNSAYYYHRLSIFYLDFQFFIWNPIVLTVTFLSMPFWGFLTLLFKHSI